MDLICPVCNEKLNSDGKHLVCAGGHAFDVARQGYVNLLTVQQKHSRNPGDTREQVLSRREFLEAGYYAPIAETLIRAARQRGIRGQILDVGCGEGYYAAQLAQALESPLVGLDISKEAVRCAAARYKGYQWLCATASHIPVEAESITLLTSLFALTLPEEYHRVLCPGGWYFQVLAQKDHLRNLKSIIYDRLLNKEKNTVLSLPGFMLEESIPIRFSFTVEGPQVRNLLSMTPHVFRIGREGALRLAQTPVLTDTASCVLNIYRRT